MRIIFLRIIAALAMSLGVLSTPLQERGLTCMTDKNKCAEDEACVKFGMMGVCKKFKEEGERCEMHQMKHLLKDYVYLVMPPCARGLKCVAKDGMIGKVLGTCQEGSGEEPDDE